MTPKYTEKKKTDFIGVSYNENRSTWRAWRQSKKDKKLIYNGTTYKDEEKAAFASDTLARKLISNGEDYHKLNFPDENIEVTPEKKMGYIGVYYSNNRSKWGAQRRSKKENKVVYNGTTYNNREAAALASDILAEKLIENGEKCHKLNFPDDHTEVVSKEMKYQRKRKRRTNWKNFQDKKYYQTEI
jgi:hypothetical protein